MEAGPKSVMFTAIPQQSNNTSSFHNDFSTSACMPAPAVEQQADKGTQEFMIGECLAMRRPSRFGGGVTRLGESGLIFRATHHRRAPIIKIE